jgi:hypothetical protein
MLCGFKWLAIDRGILNLSNRSIKSKGIPVAFDTDLAFKHFWGHEGGRSSATQFSGACRREHDSQAKFGQQSFTFGIEKDVIGLEVAVDDVLLVGIVQDFANLRESFVERQGLTWVSLKTAL